MRGLTVLLITVTNVLRLQEVCGEIVMLDMSYTYVENVTYYWHASHYYRRYTEPDNGKNPTYGYWYHDYAFYMGEHGGTHIDSPRHFSRDGWGLDQIPLSRLVNQPVVKVDVTAKTATDNNYRVTVQDMEEWEKTNGRIQEGSVVFVDIGWAKHYPARTTFLGIQNQGGNVTYNFPGFDGDTATWLAEQRRVHGVGLDGPSLDYGLSQDFPAHVNFFKYNVWGAECLANLSKLPVKGAKVTVLPIKLQGGSGAASRIYATWDTDPSRARTLTHSCAILVLTLCFFSLLGNT